MAAGSASCSASTSSCSKAGTGAAACGLPPSEPVASAEGLWGSLLAAAAAAAMRVGVLLPELLWGNCTRPRALARRALTGELGLLVLGRLRVSSVATLEPKKSCREAGVGG